MEIGSTSKISTTQEIRKSAELLERVKALEAPIEKIELTVKNIVSDFELDVQNNDEIMDQSDPLDPEPAEVNIDDQVSQDIDWDTYNGNHKYGWAYSSESKGIPDVSDRQIDQSSDNLRYSLMWQLLFSKMNAVEKDISIHIIDNIDRNGHLSLTKQELIKDIGKYLPKTIDKTLDKFQMTFDPPGIGAKNAIDSLLIQTDRILSGNNSKPIVKDIIRNYLQYVADRKCFDIARKLRTSIEDIRNAIAFILKLNPYPGRQFSNNYILDKASSAYIRPSIFLRIHNDTIHYSLVGDDNIHFIGFNPSEYCNQLAYNYHQISTNDELEVLKDDLKNRYSRHRDRIAYRYKLMKSFMDALINEQETYFSSGEDIHLKPLISKDFSGRLNIDESSVRRIRQNKWIDTPYGTKIINDFFDKTSFPKTDISRVTSKGIKSLLVRIINNEDRQKPYTDKDIASILKNDYGIQISKRVITNYRERLGILPRRMRMQCEV